MTMTTTDPKIAAIQNFYAAFGCGDLAAALADLADDVDWAAEAAGTGVPWWGSYRGKAEVPRFFKEIATNLDITEFAMIGFTSNDTDVVATVHWTFTVPATGRSASMYMQHWWRFADGKIVFFRGSEDSHQTASAFAGPPTTQR